MKVALDAKACGPVMCWSRLKWRAGAGRLGDTARCGGGGRNSQPRRLQKVVEGRPGAVAGAGGEVRAGVTPGAMPLRDGRSAEKGSRKPLIFWVSLTFVGATARRATTRGAGRRSANAWPPSGKRSSEAAPADAREGSGNRGVATTGGAGILPISRHSGQWGADESLLQRRTPHLVSNATAEEPTEPVEMGGLS
jgi:hypothetical protein